MRIEALRLDVEQILREDPDLLAASVEYKCPLVTRSHQDAIKTTDDFGGGKHDSSVKGDAQQSWRYISSM